MPPLQDHSRIPLEHPPDIGFIILAAQAQQHSLVSLGEHELLQFTTRSIDCDSRAFFTTYPTPQRIITIQHDYLVRRGSNTVEAACDYRSERVKEFLRIGDVRERVTDRVVVVAYSIEREKFVRVHYVRVTPLETLRDFGL